MVEVLMTFDYYRQPFDWYFKNGRQQYNTNKVLQTVEVGYIHKTEPGNRHPFNIITEEIYENE